MKGGNGMHLPCTPVSRNFKCQNLILKTARNKHEVHDMKTTFRRRLAAFNVPTYPPPQKQAHVLQFIPIMDGDDTTYVCENDL